MKQLSEYLKDRNDNTSAWSNYRNKFSDKCVDDVLGAIFKSFYIEKEYRDKLLPSDNFKDLYNALEYGAVDNCELEFLQTSLKMLGVKLKENELLDLNIGMAIERVGEQYTK